MKRSKKYSKPLDRMLRRLWEKKDTISVSIFEPIFKILFSVYTRGIADNFVGDFDVGFVELSHI